MYIVRFEYRLKGEKKGQTEYRERETLEEAIALRDKFIRIYGADCEMYDGEVFEQLNC